MAFGLARVDRQVWTYIGLPEFVQLARGVVFGAVFTAAAVLVLRLPDFPRSVLLLQPILAYLRTPCGPWSIAAAR